MDLPELSSRTGISRRKLRYCLDHHLIPDLRIDLVSNEAGRVRKFADDVAFGITCAALLQERGIPHPAIRLFLVGLIKASAPKFAGGEIFIAFLRRHCPAKAHLGDGVNVRVVLEEGPVDSGWFAPGNPAKLDKDYHPRVMFTLDLKVIWNLIFPGA